MSLVTVDVRYGTEKAGLLCGYVFSAGEPGTIISADEAAERLHEGSTGEEFGEWANWRVADRLGEFVIG